MTDVPSQLTAVPSRLGTTALLDERGLVVEMEDIQPEVLHHGVLRLSVLTFLVDVSAGVTLDTDPEAWTFTTDLSLRMASRPAPGRVSASTTILRRGRRSAHGQVEVVDGTGGLVAAGAIGFAHVPRKAQDPPKPLVSPAMMTRRFSGHERLSKPLREEAGIVAVDPAGGVVEIAVRPEVCNPAGTLQGAMVALVAESAAEDMAGRRAGRPMVVTELDIRYLAQAKVGPVRTDCRPLGGQPDDPIEVRLTDTATGVVSTLVYARAVPTPA
ncbi:MAG TPA: hotdog domain-containing protein [Acidimicrobiales bacterium]|nr:hotdog domain-containing protein [Acidimicrobiales bacterium]